MLRFAHFDIETRVGITLTNRQLGLSIYFQPGDEAGEIFDRLETLDSTNPDAPYEQHLAAIWADYQECAA